ncbi:hypothetical protein JD844_005928, partial [Phrynosoma platyrhinos]
GCRDSLFRQWQGRGIRSSTDDAIFMSFLISHRFRINFKAGQEVVLHINPRMDERTVVRNSFLGGRWGNEERELSFNPFQRGQYFDLSIRCGNQRFKVFANGQPLFDYNHRFHNFQQINTLEIDGDVVLSYVQY